MALLYEMSGTAEFRRQGAYFSTNIWDKKSRCYLTTQVTTFKSFFDVHSCDCLTISNIKTKSNTQIGAIYWGYGQTKNG